MAAQQAIRVLVVDDSESVRTSLHQVLGVFPDLQWVGESRDGGDVLEQCERLQPDVVLLDVTLPHVDVAETIHLIRGRYLHTQVIGITSFEEQTLIDHILRAGAALCLPKNANIRLIAEGVRRAANAADSTDLVNRTGNLPLH